ncbi:hypothetical protein FA95DRAFT_1564860 [Auriscalpium vulgare]|uniref:Uncharacterized protein n=1 Tax=Auriscalpium vulgare TaxID=40419 RepID=A0ACB8RDJ4_9AGAM|nr:hypothetical protein FA95DRAFT_1564860 [Auriscalpium vulgare]
MSAIHLDIQLVAVEWVYRASQHSTVDYRTLRACALVCRAWTPVAQRLLFRRIPNFYNQFESEHDSRLYRLLRTLRSSARLAAHVCSIKLVVIEGFDSDNHEELESPAVELLELCPDVQSISIAGSMELELCPGLEERLRAIPLHPHSLDIEGKESVIPTMERIIRMWPGVRMLDFGVYPESDDGTRAGPVLVSVPSSVRSLSISNRRPERRRSCLIWDLAPDDDHSKLSELKIEFPKGSSLAWLCTLFASGVLPQIRSLSVEGGIPTQDVLDQLTQLESLVVSVIAPWPKLVSLPQTLRHIGYHHIDEHEQIPGIKRIGNFLSTLRSSKGLQFLTVTPKMPSGTLAAFADTCRIHGVQFVNSEEGHFPWAKVVDWV